MAINHRDFWHRHLVLKEVDLVALGRQATGRGRSKARRFKSWLPNLIMDLDLRAGVRAARIASAEYNAPQMISAQAVSHLHAIMPQIDPRHAFLPIDNEPLLPADGRDAYRHVYGNVQQTAVPHPT